MKKHIDEIFNVQGDILNTWKSLILALPHNSEEIIDLSKSIGEALESLDEAKFALMDIEEKSRRSMDLTKKQTP
jgi:hypothetical protein